MKQNIEILDITSQAAAGSAGTVVFTLPQGYRFHALSICGLIAASGTPSSMTSGWGDVRMKVGGRIQRLADVVEHDAMNYVNNPPSATYGTAAATPYSVFNNAASPAHGSLAQGFVLPYFFAEPWREQYQAKERFAFDVLKGDEPVTIEVDVKSVTAAPTTSLRAIVEPIADVQADPNRSLNRVQANGRSLPTLVKHFRTTRNVGGTTLDILDLPKQDLYQHIRIFDPSGGSSPFLNAVQIEKDGQIIFKRTKAENDGELRAAGLNPTSTYFDIIPDALDMPRDAWNLSNTDRFVIKLAFAAAGSGTVKIITHRFGIPE